MIPLSIKGWQFISLVLLFSIFPYYFILSEGNSDSPWTMALMWSPSLAAIVMRIFYKEGLFSELVWNPLKDWKWLIIVSFIPLIIEIASIFLTVQFGAAELKNDFILFQNGNISIKGVSLLFGADMQPLYIFVPNYLLSFFVGTLLYSLFFALGEEYGWRGYLQKEWSPNNSLKGLVAIGVVWGLWHFPAILQGHNYPDYPLLGAFLLMPILCIIFSIAFGITFSRKHVIWIAVMFHGALNISSDVSNTALLEESINKPINDFIWTSLWILTAILLWRMLKKSNS